MVPYGKLFEKLKNTPHSNQGGLEQEDGLCHSSRGDTSIPQIVMVLLWSSLFITIVLLCADGSLSPHGVCILLVI